MDLVVFKRAVEESWGKDTCYPKCSDQWSQNNPALGQCAVTALLVQDYFGGDILYCSHNDHFFNYVEGLGEVDLTKNQFSEETTICRDEIKTRDEVMSVNAMTPERYRLLKQRVEKSLL